MEYQEAIKNHINECRHRVDVIRNHMNTNGDADTDRCLENIQVLETVIFAMNELQMYKDGKLCLIPESVYYKQCTELDAYKQLGTLEEVREAVERNKEKKVIEMVHGVHGIFDMGKSYNCPTCGSGLRYRYSVSEPIDNYCAICGQRIGWSGEDD